MSEFPHKAYDQWATQTPEDYFGYDDIEEDEQDAYTRCEKCGLRLMLKELNEHRRNKHGQK
jgi:DNA-directed RNA polymerase subunit RPC12/RpoP